MTDLPSTAWIGVFAHPDDEWLAGWPLFQRTDLQLGVILFVGDNRPGPGAPSALSTKRLCMILDQFGIQLLGCLHCAPNFFREPRSARDVWRRRVERLLAEARTGPFANAGVITHNPVGEYGHPDHIEVHRSILDVCDDQPLVITDLCYDSKLSEGVRRVFYEGKSYGPFQVDRSRWAAARALYRSCLRWTAWEWPSQNSASLYRL